MYYITKTLEVHVNMEIIFKTKIFIWNDVHVCIFFNNDLIHKYVSFKRHNIFFYMCLSSVPPRGIDTFISTINSTVIDIVWKSSVINVALFLVIGIYLLLCLIYLLTFYSAFCVIASTTINTKTSWRYCEF